MPVITLKKYCENSGDTKSAINSRVERGTWVRGKQVLKLVGIKELYIDTDAVDAWARDPKNHAI